MSGPSGNNPVSSNSEIYSGEYTYNGILYVVHDTIDVHTRLAADQDYLNDYMSLNINNIEISSVEEPVQNDCTTEDSNFKWCEKTTRERLLRFRNPIIKKKVLWMEIVDIFKKYGNDITIDILDRKMRNMKKTYRTIKDNNNKTTTGRGRVNWKYFNAFENIFTEDRTINFGPTVSNIPNPSSADPVDANMNLNPDPTCNINSDDRDNIIRPDNSASEAVPDYSIASPNLPTPSTSTHQAGTNVRSKKLENLRKKQLEIENRRVEAINVLSNRIDESNQIQTERNQFLDILIKHFTNNN